MTATKTFLNYTPHAITLNNGTTYPSVGIARVSANFSKFDTDGVCRQVFGDVTGLPDPQPDTFIIVSALVLSASDRIDLVAPATGHPQCVRDEKGFIVSVPGFVRK